MSGIFLKAFLFAASLSCSTVVCAETDSDIRVFTYDNGEDFFSEGLRRIVSEKTGKVGFMDIHGNIAIAPKYDFAYPFKNGRAKVCFSGYYRKVPGSSGEYEYYCGNKCYFIDHAGHVLRKLNISYGIPSSVSISDNNIYTLELMHNKRRLYIPYPTGYSDAEQELVNTVEEASELGIVLEFVTYDDVILDAHYTNCKPGSNRKALSLSELYEIKSITPLSIFREILKKASTRQR